MKLLAKLLLLLSLTSCHFFNPEKSIELVYGDWPLDIVLANLVKKKIEEKFDTKVDLVLTNSAGTWASIATATADISLSAWLPTTHKYYYENTKGRVDIVHPIYTGTRIGLAVPTYAAIDSIDQLDQYAEKFHHQIMGIEPGAGIMVQIEKAMKAYHLKNFKLIGTSEAVMLNMLKQDYRKKNWIVISAWEPHEMFLQFDLKFLKDPKGVFGKEEKVYAIVRKGFKEDYPEIYRFLQTFEVSKSEMEKLLQKYKSAE